VALPEVPLPRASTAKWITSPRPAAAVGEQLQRGPAYAADLTFSSSEPSLGSRNPATGSAESV